MSMFNQCRDRAVTEAARELVRVCWEAADKAPWIRQWHIGARVNSWHLRRIDAAFTKLEGALLRPAPANTADGAAIIPPNTQNPIVQSYNTGAVTEAMVEAAQRECVDAGTRVRSWHIPKDMWKQAIESGARFYCYELPSGDNHETLEHVEAIVKGWLGSLGVLVEVIDG